MYQPKSTRAKFIAIATLITLPIAFVVSLFSSCGPSNSDDQYTQPMESTNEASVNSIEHTDPIDSVKAALFVKLKAKAAKDWPNDYSTQEYWLNKQSEAYDYMKTISDDDPIKRKAQRDWPLDIGTQQYWYDKQIEARERMNQ